MFGKISRVAAATILLGVVIEAVRKLGGAELTWFEVFKPVVIFGITFIFTALVLYVFIGPPWDKR